MGMFFSNIHIRVTDKICAESTVKAITSIMTENGYTVSDKDDPDAETFICILDRPWISVCSDAFDFSGVNDTRSFISPLSNMLKTDVLAVSCFDSDYLFMNLINVTDGTDAWANVGRIPYAPMQRRTNLRAWKKKVTDYKLFKSSIRANHDFAEDVFESIEQCLDLPYDQACLCSDIIDEKYKYVKLSFSLPFSTASSEPPKLSTVSGGTTLRIANQSYTTAINKGGASTGLAVAFSGKYVENGEITFRDVQLEYDFDLHSPTRKTLPLTLEKKQTADGKWIYYSEVPEFKLHEKVSDKLSSNRKFNLENKRTIALRYTPEGNSRKVLDITVHFIPLQNPAGQCEWNVWGSYGSKRKYIEESNRIWRDRAKKQHSFVMDDCILNENDYDLD